MRAVAVFRRAAVAAQAGSSKIYVDKRSIQNPTLTELGFLFQVDLTFTFQPLTFHLFNPFQNQQILSVGADAADVILVQIH